MSRVRTSRSSVWLALAALLSLATCTQEAGPAPASSALPRQSLQIGDHIITVEVASTPEQMAQGLKYRKSLGENEGMLFVYPAPQRASFWMKDTRIPLSIAFLDSRMTILEIHDMHPYDERSTSSKSPEVAYALEVNQGWFQKRGIQPGLQVRTLEKR